jgi:carboxyl-terminal processing protease
VSWSVKHLVLILLALPLTLTASDQVEPLPVSELQQLNLESFDQVWTTIRDNHWDPELGGLDWLTVRDELRPKVAVATSKRQTRSIIEEMIGRLGQSHFAVFPSDLIDQLEAPTDDASGSGAGSRLGNGEVGVDLRIVDDLATVVSVVPDSPAAELGVRPGWTLTAVAGREIKPVIDKVRSQNGVAKGWELLLVASLQGRLRSSLDDTIPVSLVNGDGETIELELGLIREKNQVKFGYLPAMTVEVETRRLNGNVRYFACSAFLDPAAVMPRLGKVVEESIADQAAGIIVDLRGNPGGLGVMAMGMAGWFIGEHGRQLGTMHTRDSKLNFVIYPRSRAYDGPLAVLVDGLSASTAEILAAGLQDLGRARVFGSVTAGMALPSRVMQLANGDTFQYAFANYISIGGKPLEGKGVAPDQEVPLTRKALLAGKDPVLDAAQQWVASQPVPELSDSDG